MTNSNDTRVNEKTGDGTATGVGAILGGAAGGVAGGAAAGAAIGGMTGPVGALVGAAVGVVAGALAGKAAADPAAEDAYWRENYASRPYVGGGSTYDDYGPAYGYGVNAYSNNPDRKFEDVEPELSRDWGKSRGSSSLEWEHAKHASRDAWNRLSDKVERAVPGDSDRDGR
jgi:hypothetical protein